MSACSGSCFRVANDCPPQKRPHLGGIAAIECGWVALNLQVSGWKFVRYVGFAPGLSGTVGGWLAAMLVVVLFVAFSLRLPSVRENLLRPSWLKLLAVAVAVGAGILEEVIFRRWTMDWLLAHGCGAVMQVLGAGLLFGAAHAIWGLMGKSVRAAAGAMLATSLLGALLGLVFLLSDRSVTPCIAAHFLIDLLIEPGACPGRHSRRDGSGPK